MKNKENHKLKRIVLLIWVLVVLAASVFLFSMSISQMNKFSSKNSTDIASLPPIPTYTVISINSFTNSSAQILPSATLLPTLTATSAPITALPSISSPTAESFAGTSRIIGYTTLNNPITVYQFGEGPQRFLVIGGIHGGYELNTVQLVNQIKTYVQNKPEIIPDDVTLYLIPVYNVDGLLYKHLPEGRPNANGVDLNRNWPVGWKDGYSKFGCWDLLPITTGSSPASESETTALMKFILDHPLMGLVSYHSAAPGIYPADDPKIPRSKWLATHLSLASGYPYPAVYMGCEMTGTLVDWAASVGTAAVDVELTDHYNTDLYANIKLLTALLGWDGDP
ncbi:MAG: hypothetical protein JXA19_04320 [Anaerolineales bacterium]|nr:hypothetical protein [Anaerolineales bacterium]